MQHEPDAVGLVQADLDEVIAGAQGAEVAAVVGLLQARVFLGDGAEAPGQGVGLDVSFDLSGYVLPPAGTGTPAGAAASAATAGGRDAD